MKHSNETDAQSAICDYLAAKRHVFWRSNNFPRFDKERGFFFKLPKYARRGCRTSA